LEIIHADAESFREKARHLELTDVFGSIFEKRGKLKGARFPEGRIWFEAD
jgi:hypothetical protein